MKKIIIFITLIAWFFPINVSASNKLEIIYQDSIYSNRVSGDTTYSGQLGIVYIDSNLIYCLEPKKIIANEYSLGELNIQIEGETFNYIELLGNFDIKNNVYYYMAVQELIWESIDMVDVYWTDQNNGKGNIINIEVYKNKVLEETAKIYLAPKFSDNNFNVKVGENIEIEDKNNVLSNFDVISTGEVLVDLNKLVVRLDKYEPLKITLVNKKAVETMIYVGNGQTLAHFGLNYEITKNITVNPIPYDSKIKIKIYYNNYEVKEEVHFQIFNLDSGHFVTYNYNQYFKTDEFGNYYSDFYLPKGRYQIINNEIPTGYVYGDTTFFEIKEDNVLENGYYQINDNLYRTTGVLQTLVNLNNKGEKIAVKDFCLDIYADLDIYDFLGNIINKKDELVSAPCSVIGGLVTFLPLGNYYAKIRDGEKNLISDTKYSFNLEYVDKYTYSDIFILDILLELKKVNLSVKVFDSLDKYKSISHMKYNIYAKRDIIVNNVKIYTKDELIRNIITDEYGVYNDLLVLPNGEYYLKDDNYNIDYEKVEDILFLINNDIDEITLEISMIKKKSVETDIEEPIGKTESDNEIIENKEQIDDINDIKPDIDDKNENLEEPIEKTESDNEIIENKEQIDDINENFEEPLIENIGGTEDNLNVIEEFVSNNPENDLKNDTKKESLPNTNYKKNKYHLLLAAIIILNLFYSLKNAKVN